MLMNHNYNCTVITKFLKIGHYAYLILQVQYIVPFTTRYRSKIYYSSGLACITHRCGKNILSEEKQPWEAVIM